MTVEKVIPALTASTMATGDIIYYDVDQFQKVSVSTVGKVLTTVAGKPAWIEPSTTDENYCLMNYTSNYTGLTHGAWHTLEWDSNVAVTDPQTMLYDTGSNPDKIRPTETGRYLATFNCMWQSNSTSRRIAAIYHLNSSGNALGRIASQHPAIISSEISVSGIFEIGTADSEYLIVRVFQDSGFTLYLHGSSTPITWDDSGPPFPLPQEAQTWFGLQRLSA